MNRNTLTLPEGVNHRPAPQRPQTPVEGALEWLYDAYPDLFNLDKPKPLNIGIRRVLAPIRP